MPAGTSTPLDKLTQEIKRGLLNAILKNFAYMCDDTRNYLPAEFDADVLEKALATLRLRQEDISERFLDALSANFDAEKQTSAMFSTVNISFEELSLQKPEELEENIVVGRFNNYAEANLKGQLYHLRQHFHWWENEEHPRISEKSIMPKAIIRAFIGSLRPLDLDANLSLLIVQIFDAAILKTLGPSYDKVLKLMQHYGGSSNDAISAAAPQVNINTAPHSRHSQQTEFPAQHKQNQDSPSFDGAQASKQQAQQRDAVELNTALLNQELEEQKARRLKMIKKSRRVVLEEYEINLLGREVPESLNKLLHLNWVPMMGLILMKKGLHSSSWRQGVEHLKNILEYADLNRSNERDDTYRESLIASFCRSLDKVGMHPTRVEQTETKLRELLFSVEATLHSRAEKSSTNENKPEAEEQKISTSATQQNIDAFKFVLDPDTWFEIYDKSKKKTRWLKPQSYCPEKRTATFSEFDGNGPLTIKTDDLLKDIKRGKASAVNPTPRAKAMLNEMLADVFSDDSL